MPETHASHWRSFLDVGVTDSPEPFAQVCQAAHVGWPAIAVNVPEPQSVHVRSAVAVATLNVRWPAGQGSRTAMQASVLEVGEKKAPTTHASH